MSTLAERIEIEADAAEADDVDEEQAEHDAEQERQADLEPEPEPEPPSDVQLAGLERKMQAEDDRHEKAVAKLYGEGMAAMAPCPLCLAHGFLPSEPADDLEPEQRAAVLWAMGDNKPPELREHPKLSRCATCDGWGDLTTGARKDTTAVEGCPDCGGKGYRDADQMAALASVQTPLYPPPAPAPAPIYPAAGSPGSGTQITQGGHTFFMPLGAAPDQVGRVAGHPLWGAPLESGGL